MSDRSRIVKVDEDQQLVFGWANIAVTKSGETVVDAHADMIEGAELEKAAYEYVLKFGDTGVMHSGGSVGRLVESVVLTPEKASAMGIPSGSVPEAGWWVGYRIDDPATFAKVKDGTYSCFSIQGVCEVVDADE